MSEEEKLRSVPTGSASHEPYLEARDKWKTLRSQYSYSALRKLEQRSIYLRPRIVEAWTAAEEAVVTGNMTCRDATWPELPLSGWKDTYATLHLWTQIVGKIRLAG